MGNEFTGNKPWYKTVKGMVLAMFLGLFLLVVLGFTAWFFYYAWQIKYGNAGKLVEQFSSEKFSKSGILVGNSVNVSAEDLKKYTRAFDPVSGKKDSPVTIFLFADFECPHSREAQPIFKKIMEKYSPVIKVVFKHMPLVDIHPNAAGAALAAACAGEQGKFWEYYNQLFTNKKLDTDGLLAEAVTLKLDTAKFSSCLTEQKYKTQIEQDMQDAIALGVRGTPTYFVNGVKIEGVATEKDWDKIILQFLNK